MYQPGSGEAKGGCYRCLMLFISGLMMLAGIGIFGLGIYLYVDGKDIIAGTTLLGCMLGLGFMIFIISALGFCGAFKFKHSPCWLYVYTIVIFLIIAAQIGLFIYAVVAGGSDKIEEFIDNRWNDMDQDSKDSLQDNFDCCGYPLFEDDTDIATCPETATLGCKEMLEDELESIMMEIQIAAGVTLFLEILMLVLSCCLICKRKKAKNESVQGGGGGGYDNYGI